MTNQPINARPSLRLWPLTVIAVFPDGRTKLTMFSDVGHLPVEKQTWTGKGAGWTVPPARPGMR